ncbi:hypothetical protein [Burkholderia territorii]|uniref:hypothetical protein n=1 Tax=Burkholderia territorii TaxID=1503055 RepID=UPI0012D8CE8F|nr:hypothetical protein [Burkholderia territorii]
MERIYTRRGNGPSNTFGLAFSYLTGIEIGCRWRNIAVRHTNFVWFAPPEGLMGGAERVSARRIANGERRAGRRLATSAEIDIRAGWDQGFPDGQAVWPAAHLPRERATIRPRPRGPVSAAAKDA